MSQERLSMRKIEEILRLKYEVGLSHRAIAQSCSVSPSTVSEYVTHAKAAGLSWPLPEGIRTEQLNDAVSAARLSFRAQHPAAGLGRSTQRAAAQERDVKSAVGGVPAGTARRLWLQPILPSLPSWAKQLKPMMRQKHKAGEKLFVDYAGQTVPVVDPQTGEIRQAQIFVATLGASNYTYTEAHWSQDLAQLDWGAHVRALAFLGGYMRNRQIQTLY